MVPGALGWLLGVVAVLGVAWLLVVPPFQSPDETSHFGYLQHLAETGGPPGEPHRPIFSTEQSAATLAAGSDAVRADNNGRPPWTDAAAARWDAQRFNAEQRADGGGPNDAAMNPPLYYLTLAPVYLATSGSDLLTRLQTVRVVSVLWLLLTVVGAWLLAGEVLGRRRPLQLVAGAVAGLIPMVTFVSSTANPDAALYALWSLALWLGTRVIRRGARVGDAAALGAVVAAAVLTKTTSYALVPAALFALAIGAWRLRGSADRRDLALALGAAAAALLVPLAVWWTISAGLDRAATGQLANTSTNLGPARVREFASYLWQFYLPPAEFMRPYEDFTVTRGVWDYWVEGVWGSFGWLEIRLPKGVYDSAATFTVLVGVGVMVALIRGRRHVDVALGMFFALVAVALLAGLHWTAFHVLREGKPFMQGRYILPLAALFGLAAAAAVGTLPQRTRRPLIGAMLAGLLALQLLSLGTVMTRFYA